MTFSDAYFFLGVLRVNKAFFKLRILGEFLLISSLPIKVLRMLSLVDSICLLKAEPGIFDIKRLKRGILFISLQVGSLFKLAILIFPNYASILKKLREGDCF